MKNDLWKSIEEFNGLYEISPFGLVRSVKRTIMVLNRWGTINKREKPGINIKKHNDIRKYHIVSLYNQQTGKRITRKVHRLVAVTFIPNPENKSQINHKDGNKHNNHYTNLEWATHKENDDHAILNHLHPFGENNGRAKLIVKNIHEIRSKYRSGRYSISELSKEYAVGKTTIYRVIHKKSWNHLDNGTL